MKRGKGKLNVRFFLVMALTLAGCGGGGGDSPPPAANTGTNTPPADNTSPAAISGFDFTVSEGDFWEYGWDYHYTYTSAYSSSNSTSRSNFRITLGAPVTVSGVTFYEMLLSGNTKSGQYNDLKPSGKYLAVSGNKIITLGADGITQKIIFDGQEGSWPGSGFFTTFPSSTLFEATASTISNDYINQSAYRVSESSSSSQCQYFPGVGTICGGDYNENLDAREYYIPDVGPVGYYGYSSMSDWSSPDGGWSSSNTTNVGLTASSLRGDTVDYDLEVEPNNQIAQATPITLPARIKGDSVSEAYLGGTTAMPMGVVSITEVEANDSPSAPQVVNIPSSITGNALDGDANTSVEVQTAPGGQIYTTTFEDWYQVTLGTGKTLTATLNFPSTGADLDMYLFSPDGVGSVIIQANSINDNIGTNVYSEQMSKYLAAGTYYVAVDAFNTPNGRANYTLNISTGDSTINIGDWFSFSLASQTQVTVLVTGGPNFVLTDSTGSTTLASGGAGGSSATLAAGSYLIGVSDGGAYTLEVTSP